MCEGILHPLHLQNLAKQWLLEDTSNFDYSNCAVGNCQSEFVIYMKSPGVVAGIPFANAVFSELGLLPHWHCQDGDVLKPVVEIANIAGSARNLLLAERVVLNTLSRASGVATETVKMRSLLAKHGWKGELAGTRKTTPGFRMVEKYALVIGGADMHRYNLSNMVMLKDNHVTISGSIKKAVEDVRKLCGFTIKIEVECRNLQDAIAACEANCDIVMLDNFDPEDLNKTALAVKLQYPNVIIEASGGITYDNIKNYAIPWVDIISCSSLIQGYSTVDFSMKVKEKSTKST